VNDVWRSQLRKMIVKLLTSLSQYPAMSPPTIDAIFGDDDACKIAAGVAQGGAGDDSVALAATNDVIFYSMLTILKLQPYANPVNLTTGFSSFFIIIYLLANEGQKMVSFPIFQILTFSISFCQLKILPGTNLVM
jgi:hypothetical protein